MEIEIWQVIVGAAITAGISFAAGWVAMQKQQAALTQRIASLEKAVHTDVKDRITDVVKSTTDRFKSVEDRCDRQDERMTKMDERANTFVDDEEFRAYTGQTTSAVSKLTEMVGHLRGLMDGWGRK